MLQLHKQMVIIGGGWAGIAACVTAVRHGWRVTLVEERPYLGGRARSFIDKTTGEEIDNGQHLMMGAYHETLAILDTLGTRKWLRMQDALYVPFVGVGGTSDLLDAHRFTGTLGVADAILRLKQLSLRSRLRIILMAARLRLGRIHAGGLTCVELLRSEKQTEEAIRRFWEPIILATLNAPSSDADARMLVEVMRLAFLGSGDDSKLMLPAVGLSHLIEPFTDWLSEQNGRVLLSTSCDELVVSDGRVAKVTLNDGSLLDADAVVCAIPERALQRLVATESFNPGPSSPIVSVYLWYDRSWMQQEFVASLGTTIQWVFNRRRMQHHADADVVRRYPGHVSLTISAGSELAGMDGSDILAACDLELRTLFPEMGPTSLLHGIVIKERSATPLFTPNAERPRVDLLAGFASNLAIAGDWTDTGLPATIEGASRSGVTAVEWLSSSTSA